MHTRIDNTLELTTKQTSETAKLFQISLNTKYLINDPNQRKSPSYVVIFLLLGHRHCLTHSRDLLVFQVISKECLAIHMIVSLLTQALGQVGIYFFYSSKQSEQKNRWGSWRTGLIFQDNFFRQRRKKEKNLSRKLNDFLFIYKTNTYDTFA